MPLQPIRKQEIHCIYCGSAKGSTSEKNPGDSRGITFSRRELSLKVPVNNFWEPTTLNRVLTFLK